jgi:hypothetical protein
MSAVKEKVDQETEDVDVDSMDEKALLRSMRQELKELRKLQTAQLEQSKPEPAKLKRSKMSTAEKANYIGQHGQTAYFQIPWD